MRFHAIVCLVLLGGVGWSAPAPADFPWPSYSDVDPCIVVCPAGDSLFRVIARHPFYPWPNGDTQLPFCDCPGVTLAPLRGHEQYTILNGCIAHLFTDVNGVADFRVRAGGVCSGATINVYCDGIVLATRTVVASPDQNGDLVVDEADESILLGKLGTSDLTADFDCDRLVTAADLAIAHQHLGHSESTIVGVGTTVPASYRLLPARPNPTRHATTLAIELPVAGEVTVEIFDVTGRLVRVLFPRQKLPAGTHAFTWDGRDASGAPVSGGVYVASVRAGTGRAVRNLVILR